MKPLIGIWAPDPVHSANLAGSVKLLVLGSGGQSARAGYYFAFHDLVPPLPVYRVVAGDAQHTRYYLDPLSGARLLRPVQRCD